MMIRNLRNLFSRNLHLASRKNASECEQALLRVFIALIIFIFLYYKFLSESNPFPTIPVFTFSGLWLVSGFIIAVIALRSNEPSEKKQFLTMLADISAVTFGMLMTDETGVLFFGIYIWVTIGNGIRYGAKSLLLSQFMSIIGYCCVLLTNNYWSAHTTFSAGLMLILVMIPIYTFKLLERLNQAIKHADEASKAKSSFLANMSHEMRTPLNGVIGISDLILGTPLNAEQKDLVQTLRNSGRILLKLVEEVLDLSRIESGKLTAEIVDFDLHVLINGIISMFSPQAEQKGLRLLIHFSHDTGFRYRGDAQHLRQVIVNLLGNAIKFTHEGTVDLQIYTLSQDEKTARLKFEVIDTGIGIAQESQQAIFESFTQANKTITGKYGGTGLGTTISKQLVEFMGGQIGLHSEVGKGSTFWFELPFEKQPQARTLEAVSSLRGVLVLIAGLPDDQQTTITGLLSSWGVRFDLASSSARLFQFLNQIQPARQKTLIILCSSQGLAMPPEDIASRVEIYHSLSRVALILVGPTDFSEEALFEMGYSCLLNTPINNSELFNALHGAVLTQTSDDDIPFLEDHGRSSKNIRNLHILVAEDNATNRMIISKILERAGHSVDLVNDGEQALDALENNRYNLAIIDMQMPVMPGLEAVKIYRITARHEQRIPIIILTANATTEAKRECEEAGADAFLTKPIDASRLLDTVARLATPYVATRQENKKPAASIVTESTKLLNEDTLHRLSLLGGGESDFLGIVVRGFISEGEHLVSAMEAALSKGEYGTFKELAHALKGSSGNVGAEALFQTCRKISRINQNDQLVSAEKLLGDVKAGFGATRQALTQHLEALKTP